ncbi:MAG: DUF2271 domain-containing protein [Planctomycetota bacterium]
MMRLVFALGFLCFGVLQHSARAETFQFNHEHVLGTSLQLTVDVPDQITARKIERAALSEIDRLNSVLSSYDAASEFSKWQRAKNPTQVSCDLAAVLRRAEHWRMATAGAFDVRAISGASVSTSSEQAPYRVSTTNETTRLDSASISLDAIAKGYILDSVSEKVCKQFDTLSGFTINIGGDIRTCGDAPLTVGVTDPFAASENDPSLVQFLVEGNAGVATSGGYRRGHLNAGERQSHIIDPRSGQSVSEVASVTVIAPNATDADASATAVSVLGASDGIKLIEGLDGYHCLVVLNDGQVLASSNWPSTESDVLVAMQSDEEKPGLIVDFKLNRPRGGRYRRPYVAVWLEDEDGYPVKTALLWLQTDQPGPRWHRDLTRWYRNDRMRKVVEKKNMIGTISGATRGPGEYQARFDGTDNEGNKLSDGKYTLCLEVAREHGTYQIIREPVVLDGKPIAAKELKSNVEMSAVKFRYVPVSDAE